MMNHYGVEQGVRVARKHLCWYLEPFEGAEPTRQRVVRAGDPNEVVAEMSAFLGSDPLPAFSEAA